MIIIKTIIGNQLHLHQRDGYVSLTSTAICPSLGRKSIGQLIVALNRYRLTGSLKPVRFSPSHREMLANIHLPRGLLSYAPSTRQERMWCDELESMGYIVRGAYQHRYITDRGIRKLKSCN